VHPSRKHAYILIYTGHQVSSIYITPTKKVVVGRDLFTATHDDRDIAEFPGDLSDWLQGELRNITMLVRCVSVQQLLRSSLIPKLFLYSFFLVIQQQLIGLGGSVRCLSPIVSLSSLKTSSQLSRQSCPIFD
jgi:hypothetical protein